MLEQADKQMVCIWDGLHLPRITAYHVSRLSDLRARVHEAVHMGKGKGGLILRTRQLAMASL